MYSVLIYGFPVILVLFETALRYILRLDTFGFLGPTLSAAAITSLVGNVRPKIQEILDASGNKYLVINRIDHQFIAFCWLILFVMLLAWAASCYVSSNSEMANVLVLGVELQFFIGLVAYIVSMALVAVKGLL